MGLFDLFKPKWKHSDPEVRLNAVRRLVAGEPALTEVARHDGDARVRRVAIKKIDDPLLLEALAADDRDEAVRAAAAEKAAEILLGVAVGDGHERESRGACERLKDQRSLAEVAKRAALEPIRRLALEKLSDQRLLADVALGAADAGIREAAFAAVTDAAALRELACAPEATKSVAMQALARIEEPAALTVVAERARSKVVRGAAKARLKALAPPKQVDAEELRRREEKAAAQRDAVVERARRAEQEKAARARAAEEARARAAAEEARLEEERRKAEEQAAAERAARQAERAARAAERAARDAEREKARAEKEAERARVQAERDAERARRKAEREAEDAARRERLERVCARLEELGSSEDLKQVQAALKEAQEAFREAGRAGAELRPRYDAARGTLVIRAQELREADEWRRWANVPRLEALCKKAEELRDAPDVEPKALAQQLKELQAEWKKLGAAPREKSEELWNRFKAVGDQIHERAQAHFAVLDEERQKNLQRKEELCARAEAAAESSDWKETTELFKLLQAEWKGIGPVPKERSDAIWKRFRGAADKFFERRQAMVELTDEEKQAVLTRLEAIVAEAESLAGSTSWKATAERLKALQGEWKHAGVAPRAESDPLWTRFRAACDEFFGRRKADLDSRGAERAQNLAKKEAMCQKVEALVEATGRGEGPADPAQTIRELMAEWKQIGPAPREQSDEVWKRFRAGLDNLRHGGEEEPEQEAPPPPAADEPRFANKLPLGMLKVPTVVPKAPAEAPAAAAAPPADAAPASAEAKPEEKP